MRPIFDNYTISDIILLLGALVRLIGFLGIGLTAGWLTLEFLRKAQQAWQLQIAVFLGLLGLVIAMTLYLAGAPTALGLFGIGLTAAILLWGLPKKEKKEEKKKDED
ncbi:MAG: hypothetical protein ABWK53_09920 [Anaerolineales bacterium]